MYADRPRPALVRLWLALLVPLIAGSVLVGNRLHWSATTVAVVIAISAAYLMFPPMVLALFQWGQLSPPPASGTTVAAQDRVEGNRPRAATPALTDDGGRTAASHSARAMRPATEWDLRLTPVLRVFAEALPGQEDRDAIRELAGVRAAHIAAARSPQNAWQAVFAAAVDQSRLDQLLDAGAERSSVVASAVAAYRTAP